MNIRIYLISIVFFIFSPLYAGHFLENGKALTLYQCPISETSNPMDLALLGPGYFVVSEGKKNSEKLFSRYGRLYLDKEGYVRTDSNYFLLRITKKNDPTSLRKIKISSKNLPPKAAEKAKIEVNLPANAGVNDFYETSAIMYDDLAIEHVLTIKFAKVDFSPGIWSVKVYNDKVFLSEGRLSFDFTGQLKKQEGLSHIQWTTDYGLHELKTIDFKNSTQYGIPFTVNYFQTDGHGLGSLVALSVSRKGEIQLMYNNGQGRTINGRIAIAKFTNPSFLKSVGIHLYKPTEKSGDPMIHWLNSDSIYSGVLEEEPC